jgi:hypothetical protein
MPGPGDEIAAGAGGRRLRASHADREQVIDVLKAAFVQGMLAKDEFDLRVSQVLTSRTCADLNTLTADIPSGLTAAQPPPEPPSESDDHKFIKALACVLVALPSAAVGAGLSAVHDSTPGQVIIGVILLACVLAVPATGLVMLHSWLEKRESRLPSQGSPPSAGGTASHRLAPADPAGQLTQISHDPRRRGLRRTRRDWTRPTPTHARPTRTAGMNTKPIWG